MPTWQKLAGWTVARIVTNGGRAHFEVGGRFITVLLHRERLYCIDSACHHAAGPLGEGPVEDIEDIPCIRCPWHNFLVSLDKGEDVTCEEPPIDFGPDGVYRAPLAMSYPLQPAQRGKATRGALVQRVHQIAEADDGELMVMLDVDESGAGRFMALKSDLPSTSARFGRRSMEIRQIKLDEHREHAPGADVH